MATFYNEQYPYNGTSLEELRQYTEVLLGSAEVAEMLASHEPIATDTSFSVSDPRKTELVRIPEEIADIAGHYPQIINVIFESIAHTRENQEYASSKVTLEFADFPDVRFEKTNDAYIAYINVKDGLERPISASCISDIISRITHPSNDPIFADFQNINHPVIAREISETLENDDTISHVIEKTYLVDDKYIVVVDKNNTRLTSCEITELREDTRTANVFTVEYSNFATASRLYQTSKASKELIIDLADVEHFLDIIKHLKSTLEPNADFGPLLDEYGFDSPDTGA